MKQQGKLFGIGVGPGDPELITKKAIRLINEADVIFTAASTKNNYSLALKIAEPYISKNADIQNLSFPMIKDKIKSAKAWNNNAEKIAMVLDKGKSAAFITLGDPVTYSTFGYILQAMKNIRPEADIEIVPGITSFHAAAARCNKILVEAEETLAIMSGAYGGENIRAIADKVDKIAIVKAYKNTEDINNALKETGFMEKSIAISKCGRKGEEIIDNIKELENRAPDYWTLILAAK
jgi:precorrin-2/cobalt-factor-2 C20-methyltransferase